MAALSIVAFLVLDQPAHRHVSKTIAFDNATVIISEDDPDPDPHAFAISVPDQASDVHLNYVFEFSAPDRPGGQEESIRVFFALFVDGEEGKYLNKWSTPTGEREEVKRSALSYGQSSNDRFVNVARIHADIEPGFHVVHLSIDTTDSMTEDWAWTVEPQRAELDYRLDAGWRAGPFPVVGLVLGLGAALALWAVALKAAVRIHDL